MFNLGKEELEPYRDKAFVRRYSLDEAVSMILEADKQGKYASGCSSHNAMNDEWAGATWKESVELLTGGWSDGVPRIETIARTRIAESLRPKPVWDVAGSECDVAAYLAGVPECMGEIVRRRRPSPVVRIGVDRAASHYIKRDKIELLGRNVLLLVEGLRLSGVAAEIWVGQAVYRRTQVYDIQVCIQEAGRPIDVGRLAYWLAHPAALRRTLFALEEIEPMEVRKAIGFGENIGVGGYGSPVPQWAADSFDEWAPGANDSPATIEAWVKDVMTRRAG